MTIRYVANKQKRQEYNGQKIDIWAFRSFLSTVGRRLRSVPNCLNNWTGFVA